ncbi:minor capsid protein [Capybara microvirus Cap3_SP_481]|nr:minor capsid protein [Capybara microvirus Cap3_SP_481]
MAITNNYTSVKMPSLLQGIGNATVSNAYNLSQGSSWGSGTSNSSGYSEGGTWGTGATASALSQAMMQEANRYNAEQAELNRQWQEHMANTAYQRAMKDLAKAGLNPILAYTNGGAATGSGAMASSAMGTAYTDTYNRSENSAESYSANGSSNWSDSLDQSTTNMANQIGAIIGMGGEALKDLVGIVEGKASKSNNGITVDNKVTGYNSNNKWKSQYNYNQSAGDWRDTNRSKK